MLKWVGNIEPKLIIRQSKKTDVWLSQKNFEILATESVKQTQLEIGEQASPIQCPN